MRLKTLQLPAKGRRTHSELQLLCTSSQLEESSGGRILPARAEGGPTSLTAACEVPGRQVAPG